MKLERFWVVWCADTERVTFRHDNEHGANLEARRLASANHGKHFFVLEAKRLCVKQDVVTIEIEDELPF